MLRSDLMPRKTKKNFITSPELIAQINPENRQLLDDYINYMRSIQRSETTIEAYISDINIAFVWNLQFNNNKSFIEWTKRNVVAYQNWLLNNNENSPARVKRLKASLSSMSNYVCNVLDDEYPNFRNIINKVESPINTPVREKSVFTEEQIDNLLAKLVEQKKYDKACALALALYSGRRKSELLRFKVSDFNDDHLVCEGALYKSDPIKTKGRGVHGKMLECFCLAKKFKPYFDMWMEDRERNNIKSEWLFPEPGKPEVQMKVTTLDSWANTFSRYLDMDFYWHSMRHMTVTNFKRFGIPDSVIQSYIGWADLSMVTVYSDLKADEQLSMYFNADGMVKPEAKSLADM